MTAEVYVEFLKNQYVNGLSPRARALRWDAITLKYRALGVELKTTTHHHDFHVLRFTTQATGEHAEAWATEMRALFGQDRDAARCDAAGW
jgi:hypothetical protein